MIFNRLSPETRRHFWIFIKYLLIPYLLWLLLAMIVTFIFYKHPELFLKYGPYVGIFIIAGFIGLMIFGMVKIRRKIKIKRIKIESFKKAGILFIVVGLLDICLMIVAILNRTSYGSSLNIFAIAAGISMIRGNIKAVRFTRWNVAFMLSIIIAGIFILPIVGPLFEPPELFKIRFKLNPWPIIVSSVLMFGITSLLCVVHYLLNKKESLEALKEAGYRTGRPKLAYVGGLVIVGAMTALFVPKLNSEEANRAKIMAMEKFGTGYKYHVTGIQIYNNQTTFVVTAYNENEIRTVEINW